MKVVHIVKSFQIKGVVEAVLVASTPGTHICKEVPYLSVFINEGIRGDRHSGRRLADVREKDFINFGLMKRTEIRNHREFSAISMEEMKAVAEEMGIENVPLGFLGENLVISGISRLSHLPIGTKLFFKSKSGLQTAVLLISGENTPCHIPGDVIQDVFPEKIKLSSLFIKAAASKRGIVGSIFCSGRITKGDEVIAVVPLQREYSV